MLVKQKCRTCWQRGGCTRGTWDRRASLGAGGRNVLALRSAASKRCKRHPLLQQQTEPHRTTKEESKQEKQEILRSVPDPAPSCAMEAPRNRKQRRAAAAAASSSTAKDSFDPSSIPLSYPPPPDAKPRTKTLIEIAAEREAELRRKKGMSSASASSEPPEAEYFKISPDGEVSRFNPSDKDRAKGAGKTDDEPIPPLIDTILLSFPLSALHCTLAFLTAHQYAQHIPVRALIRESAVVALPVLTFLIHLAHGHIVSFGGIMRSKKEKDQDQATREDTGRFELSASSLRRLLLSTKPRTLFFLPLAVYLGGYLIALTNDDPYYAVMKRAPAIGTLWVWCILEMSLGAAILGVLAPITWGVLWKGYGII